MEKQKVLKIKNNRRVVFQDINIEGEAGLKREDKQGWLNIRELVGRVEGLKQLGFIPDNSRILVVDERDGYPISPYRPPRAEIEKQRGLQKVTEGGKVTFYDQMADRAAEYQDAQAEAKAKRTLFNNTLAYAGLAIVFVTLVIILLAWRGNLNLGAIK